ncbi:hypothetical protein Slin15195_G037620 [Septoria linicola]|uniref:F-box domain-containing protein n=1 Tax=Septoria linicola TaxID=215465 RepID=A0A9Q9AQN5_9PEZI|nr:hypothetical protein Slin14017_G119030 [Septoria linicola]USW50443.1 hypothetical protein Slin15195_G037620 [Septoria linicola]
MEPAVVLHHEDPDKRSQEDTEIRLPFDQIQALVNQNRQLRDSLAHLTESSGNSKISKHSIRPNPEASPVALQVFDMPELHEMILLEFHAAELLPLMQVNRQFHNAIQSSVNIRRHMGLAPNLTANLYSPVDMSLP